MALGFVGRHRHAHHAFDDGIEHLVLVDRWWLLALGHRDPVRLEARVVLLPCEEELDCGCGQVRDRRFHVQENAHKHAPVHKQKS